MRCPKCQSTMTEEHGLFTGETHWCFCRECGWSWDVKDEKEEKKDEQTGNNR